MVESCSHPRASIQTQNQEGKECFIGAWHLNRCSPRIRRPSKPNLHHPQTDFLTNQTPFLYIYSLVFSPRHLKKDNASPHLLESNHHPSFVTGRLGGAFLFVEHLPSLVLLGCTSSTSHGSSPGAGGKATRGPGFLFHAMGAGCSVKLNGKPEQKSGRSPHLP